MATTYKADNYAQPMPAVPAAGISVKRVFKFTVAAAFVINDIVKLCPIKAGSGIILDDYYIDVPDLDTNGAPAIKLDLGDNDTAAKFIAASTVGQAAGLLVPTSTGAVAAALPVKYTADNDFALKINTAPATGATSVSIKGWLSYHNIGVASII